MSFILLVYVDVAFLSESINAVLCLRFQLWIPVHVDQHEVVGSDEVQTYAPGGQRQQQDVQLVMLIIEPIDDLL